MDLASKIVVITSGISDFSVAMAKLFKKLKAVVIITDANETILKEKAAEIGVMAIAANLSQKENMKEFIDKVIRQFLYIDIFISNTGTAKSGNPFLPDAGWGCSWQLNVLMQMYAAKYLLPHMIKKRVGYLINMVPMEGLFTEYHSPLYNTTRHAGLFFAERLATVYKNFNIKVSVLCTGALINLSAIKNACTNEEKPNLDKLARYVADAIHNEQFMIPSYEKICGFYQPPYPDFPQTNYKSYHS